MSTLEQIFDPRAEAVSLLVVGRSGSGKSSFLRRACEIKSQPILMFGGSRDDYGSLEVSYLPELVSSVTRLQDCICVQEDLFGLSKKQHHLFREMVCFQKRHHNVTVLCAVHTLNYTGMLNLTSQFDYVAFTKPRPDEVSVTQFMRHMKPHNLRPEHFEKIPPMGYLVYNTKTDKALTINRHFSEAADSDKASPAELRERLRSDIASILKVFPEQYDLSLIHAELVLKNIEPSIVNPQDFSLRLVSPQGVGVTVSLVDFLIECQADGADEPSPHLLLLRKFLAGKFHTPLSLIKNPRLRLAPSPLPPPEAAEPPTPARGRPRRPARPRANRGGEAP